MAWPATAVATGELITAAQLNGLPVMIANSTLGAPAANIDFTSIPGHYAHLMVVAYLRGDTAATSTNFFVRLNADGGSNYDHQQLIGFAATVQASEVFGAAQIVGGDMPANTAGANLFSAHVIDIPHYANTANNKSVATSMAFKRGTATGNMIVYAIAGFWRSNAAVTGVRLIAATGNLNTGSRATLYGIA